MIDSLGMIENPAAALADLRTRASGSCALMSFELAQYWLPGTPTIILHALCLVEGTGLLCVISDSGESLADTGPIDRAALARLAEEIDATVVDLGRPLRLDTVRIEKPWGAEIWYTGVEERGVCSVGNTPLPWVVAMAGELLCGAASSHLVLLKILDPHPEPVYGDLYFEMHEQKVEVYVVTHVEDAAWPEGVGAIRFGFDQEKLGEFISLEDFKDAWLESVNAYRRVRREIDDRFDAFREIEGIGPAEVIPPAVAESWRARLDSQLNDREQRHREAMNAFTALAPIQPGDVVRVPPFTPHSLQHGVRVVEFQTPHYERYILSFAQKVLTQSHWDTAEAIDKIDWRATFETRLATLESTDEHCVDQVADFDAFEVRRIRLGAGVRYRIALSTYAIAMAIESNVNVGGIELAPEQACLVPALLAEIDIAPAGDAGCLVLLATPKTPG